MIGDHLIFTQRLSNIELAVCCIRLWNVNIILGLVLRIIFYKFYPLWGFYLRVYCLSPAKRRNDSRCPVATNKVMDDLMNVQGTLQSSHWSVWNKKKPNIHSKKEYLPIKLHYKQAILIFPLNTGCYIGCCIYTNMHIRCK